MSRSLSRRKLLGAGRRAAGGATGLALAARLGRYAEIGRAQSFS
jgi:hypothetical protein